jgi:hypothetical protein
MVLLEPSGCALARHDTKTIRPPAPGHLIAPSTKTAPADDTLSRIFD